MKLTTALLTVAAATLSLSATAQEDAIRKALKAGDRDHADGNAVVQTDQPQPDGINHAEAEHDQQLAAQKAAEGLIAVTRQRHHGQLDPAPCAARAGSGPPAL